jgi:hypothetical protein
MKPMRAVLALALLVFLSACSAASDGLIPVTGLSDLGLVSVRRVATADPFDRGVAPGPLLKVTVATATDIAVFARSHAGPVVVQPRGCGANTPDGSTLLYDRYGEIAADPEAAARRAGSDGQYHFYVAVLAAPADICATIVIGEGRYLGMAVSQFVSNSVVVPREAIAAAQAR